jgi:hypothetical protein
VLTNPYAPSPAVESGDPAAKSPTTIPALLLIVLLIPTLLYDAFFAYVIVADIMNAGQVMGWSFSMIREWGFLLRCFIVFSAHCMILLGAIWMLRNRRYWFAVASCMLSLVPVLTPVLVLGIPVGAWGLLVLRREAVRSAFRRNKT